MVLGNQLRSLDFHQNVSPKWPVWKDFSINTPNLETCKKWYAMANELVPTKDPVWGQELCNNRILNLTVKFNFFCALWGASYLWASLLVVKCGVLINHMFWSHGSQTHDFSRINKFIIGVISVYFPNYKVKSHHELSSYGTHKENTYCFRNELDAYLSAIRRMVLIKQEFCFGMLAKAALMPLSFVRGTNF